MLEADALVAEVTPDLVDAVQAAHRQPLEIELEADAQVEILVQLVVMRHKRARRRAAVDGLEDGRFHFQKALAVQIFAQRAHDARAQAEDVAHLGVGDEIHVAPAVASLLVAQAVPLVGHGLERLAQELDVVGLDAQLAGLGHHHGAGGADEVAQVDELLPDGVVPAVGQVVAADDDLDAAGAVFQVGKAHLAHDANALQPSGHGNLDVAGRARFVERTGGGDGVGAFDARRIRVDARIAQRLQVVEAGALLVGQVLRREHGVGGLGHEAFLPTQARSSRHNVRARHADQAVIQWTRSQN